MSVVTNPVSFVTPREIEASIPATIAHLQSHRILAYPTETVYGFGGSIDAESVNALVTLKHRPGDKPMLLLISTMAMVSRLALHLTPHANELASRFWPGPLTLVLPGGAAHLPAPLRGSAGGIAVRWTSHPGILRLLDHYDAPLTSTSANLHGSAPATTAHAITQDWRPEIQSGLIRLLDGGELPPSLPSTVVDCIGSSPRLIRPGAIPIATLREVVPSLIAPQSL